MIKIYSMGKKVLVLKKKNDVEGRGRWIKGKYIEYRIHRALPGDLSSVPIIYNK